MKRAAAIITAATFIVTAASACFAAVHDHGSSVMDMADAAHAQHLGNVIHEEVVAGVKATFRIISMQEQLKGMKLPQGVKETHHLMVVFKNSKTGKPLTEGTARVKILAPDRSEQVKDLASMGGHFGVDLDFSKKGRYGIMVRSKLADGKVRDVKFWYEVK